MLHALKFNRLLIFSLVRREVIGRYRGSVMGILWSFLHPMLMLAVYTFVFSVVFKARWPGGSESKSEFALVLFAGLIFFNLFSETIQRSPGLIVSHTNYVKKVIFPLEILPVVALGSALFHFAVSLGVWLLFYGFLFGLPPLTVLFLPLLLLPFTLLIVGCSWFLAALGVYLRDIAQVMGIFVTILLFLSPIFYAVSSLPEKFVFFLQFNPLTFYIEQARDIMIWGKSLDFLRWGFHTVMAMVIALLGFACFQKMRRGFADVL